MRKESGVCPAQRPLRDSGNCPHVREQGRALFRVEPKSHGTGHALDLAQLLLHYPDGWGEQSNIISVSQRCDMLSQHVDRCLFRIFR
ncbi:hypothetical protein T4B_2038 [Trichinella pseudospiralis]|uniref:Uncharacterized protein n=1 Tax=Trichinella pseudospiralis TaxID=6337 RepID=A0A0V1J3Z3_TRIPS|nr:hypothetical protein T4B_2038 [Trichinella pseudospiralis]KRZ29679.1 hypothetical protein T4C_7314 [Trichinella pseudospiralis]